MIWAMTFAAFVAGLWLGAVVTAALGTTKGRGE